MKAVEGFKYCKVCGDMFFEEYVGKEGKCVRCKNFVVGGRL